MPFKFKLKLKLKFIVTVSITSLLLLGSACKKKEHSNSILIDENIANQGLAATNPSPSGHVDTSVGDLDTISADIKDAKNITLSNDKKLIKEVIATTTEKSTKSSNLKSLDSNLLNTIKTEVKYSYLNNSGNYITTNQMYFKGYPCNPYYIEDVNQNFFALKFDCEGLDEEYYCEFYQENCFTLFLIDKFTGKFYPINLGLVSESKIKERTTDLMDSKYFLTDGSGNAYAYFSKHLPTIGFVYTFYKFTLTGSKLVASPPFNESYYYKDIPIPTLVDEDGNILVRKNDDSKDYKIYTPSGRIINLASQGYWLSNVDKNFYTDGGKKRLVISENGDVSFKDISTTNANDNYDNHNYTYYMPLPSGCFGSTSNSEIIIASDDRYGVTKLIHIKHIQDENNITVEFKRYYYNFSNIKYPKNFVVTKNNIFVTGENEHSNDVLKIYSFNNFNLKEEASPSLFNNHYSVDEMYAYNRENNIIYIKGYRISSYKKFAMLIDNKGTILQDWSEPDSPVASPPPPPPPPPIPVPPTVIINPL
ncbi:MAG: hypothetical protein HQK51_20980 [Oligoflexia bacterium]|nr:hypothetical protein [Oligoflexia bacterium]